MAVSTITAEVFTEPSTFAKTWLKVLDKQSRVVPLRYNVAQRHYLDNRTSRDLVLKARQLGFSTMIQAELFRYAVTGTARTLTLAHKNSSTQTLRRIARRFFEYMPPSLPLRREYDNATLTTYPDFSSEAMVVTAGGKGPGRSLSTSHQHWSEVAYWSDAARVVAGVMQAGSPDWIAAESTANGTQGWFYERCMEALDGSPEWTLHFYPWWWDADYFLPLVDDEILEYTDDEARLVERYQLTPEQVKWRRAKWQELRGVGGSQNLFPQEYPEDISSAFLQSGGSYFGDLSSRYGAPLSASVREEGRYFAGLDFAQTTDYTVCTVVDATGRRQMDMVRVNRQSWEEMRRRVRVLCARWGVKTLVAEANSMGTTNIEAMRGEFAAERLETRIVEFHTTSNSKAQLAAAWHKALHEDGWQMQGVPERKAEYRAFVSSQTALGHWQLGAASGHDDIVIADMLAFHACQYGERRWIR